MGNKEVKKQANYLREQGSRQAHKPKKRKLTFSLKDLIDISEGQSSNEWQALGLLAQMFEMMRHLCQYTCEEALRDGSIKQYGKFPANSKFSEPKHISGVNWGVMHITKKSKEVVAGYFEDDIFHIVFLDKDHLFYPTAER